MLSHSTQLYWIITRSHAHNYSNGEQQLPSLPKLGSRTPNILIIIKNAQCHSLPTVTIYEVRTVLNALVWEFGAWSSRNVINHAIQRRPGFIFQSSGRDASVLLPLCAMHLNRERCCAWMAELWTMICCISTLQTNDTGCLTPYHHHHWAPRDKHASWHMQRWCGAIKKVQSNNHYTEITTIIVPHSTTFSLSCIVVSRMQTSRLITQATAKQTLRSGESCEHQHTQRPRPASCSPSNPVTQEPICELFHSQWWL